MASLPACQALKKSSVFRLVPGREEIQKVHAAESRLANPAFPSVREVDHHLLQEILLVANGVPLQCWAAWLTLLYTLVLTNFHLQ